MFSKVPGAALKYRPDIDGLRALAVTLVILFHAFPKTIPGGFVGVDVFFVISGYLISGIIFRELKEGNFSFRNFYIRRLCRIIPALILVLLFCLVFGWCVLLPDEYRALGGHIKGGAFYYSNFLLLGETGYFDVSSELKPLLHLWSLAIEEQFYILWPLIAVILFRWKRGLFPLLAFFFLSSFAYNLILTEQNISAAFYRPEARIWELLAGAGLAYMERFRPGFARRFSFLARRDPWGLRSVLGLGLLVFAVFFFNKKVSFPDWRALLPVCGTVLMIGAGRGAWLNKFVLSRRGIVFIGLISYPLYLWHWPLFSFARIMKQGHPGAEEKWALIALAILLAVLTYLFVERPIRFGKTSRGKAAIGLFLLCSLLGGAGYALQRGIPEAYSARLKLEKYYEAYEGWEYPTPDAEKVVFEERQMYLKPGRGDPVLFLGDSNMEQYWPRVTEILTHYPERYRTAIFLTGGGCVPIFGVLDLVDHPHCQNMLETALAYVEANKIKTVVIGANWPNGFISEINLIEGAPLNSDKGRKLAYQALEETVRRFAGEGRKVFVIMNIPHGEAYDPRSLIDRGFLFFQVAPDRGGTTAKLYKQYYGKILDKVHAAAIRGGAEIIEPMDFLCSGAGLCPALEEDGEIRYKDRSHLHPAFVRKKVLYLDRILE